MKKSTRVWSLVSNVVLLGCSIWGLLIPILGLFGTAKIELSHLAFMIEYDGLVLLALAAVVFIIADIVSLSKGKKTPAWINILMLAAVATVCISTCYYVGIATIHSTKGTTGAFNSILSWKEGLFPIVIAPVLAFVAYILFALEPKKVRIVNFLWGALPVTLWLAVTSILVAVKAKKAIPYNFFDFANTKGSTIAIYFVAFVLGSALIALISLLIKNAISKHAIVDDAAVAPVATEVAPEEAAPVVDNGNESAPTKPVVTPVKKPASATRTANTTAAPTRAVTSAPTTRTAPTAATPTRAPLKPGVKRLVIVKSESDLIKEERAAGIDIQEDDNDEEMEERAEIEAAKANSQYRNGARVYHISKQASGKWQVKLATGEKAIKLFDTQALAIDYAKALVKSQGGSIRIHSVKGKLRKE